MNRVGTRSTASATPTQKNGRGGTTVERVPTHETARRSRGYETHFFYRIFASHNSTIRRNPASNARSTSASLSLTAGI